MIGEFLAAKPERMPRISPFDINSLQESAASLLSCAPIVEREMPTVVSLVGSKTHSTRGSVLEIQSDAFELHSAVFSD